MCDTYSTQTIHLFQLCAIKFSPARPRNFSPTGGKRQLFMTLCPPSPTGNTHFALIFFLSPLKPSPSPAESTAAANFILHLLALRLRARHSCYSSMAQQPQGGDLSSKLVPNPSVHSTPSIWSAFGRREANRGLARGQGRGRHHVSRLQHH